MTITINGEQLDYTLEAEKTIGDVVTGLSDWLRQSEMFIDSLEIDGIPTSLTEKDWKSMDLHSVATMAVSAVGIRESRLIHLESARDYFSLLKSSMENGENESLEELAASYPDIRRLLPSLLNEGPVPTIVPRLDAVFAESGFPARGGSGIASPREAAAAADGVAALLDKRLRETAYPEEQSAVAATELVGLTDSLDEAAVQLQTGNDKAAMETIIRLTDQLQVFMRSLPWIPDRANLKRIADDLMGVLAEFEEALKAKDTVLIADLLEYEFKPRLIALPKALSGEVDV